VALRSLSMEVSPQGAVVEGGSDAAAARVRVRLSELDLARRAACEQRRSASAEAADPAQSVAAFAARAESCRRSVESTLASLAEPLAREGPHASAEDVRERVAAALLLVTALEQARAQSCGGECTSGCVDSRTRVRAATTGCGLQRLLFAKV